MTEASAAGPAVSGSVVLTFKDSVMMSAYLLRRYNLLYAGLLVFGAFVLFQILGPEQSVQTWNEGWPYIVGGALVMMVFPHICSVIAFLRSPQTSRTIAYQADAERMTTSDANGAMVMVPWTLVRSGRPTANYLFLKLTTRGWRIYPRRAFAPADFDTLVAWSQRGTKPQPA